MSLKNRDFTETGSGYEQPARRLVTIAPNNSVDLAQPVRGIYVGGTGDLNVVAIDDADGATQTLSAVPQGTFVPITTKRVMSTGTTATLLIGLI